MKTIKDQSTIVGSSEQNEVLDAAPTTNETQLFDGKRLEL